MNKANIDIIILDEIDLQVSPISKVGIIGKSGSGKSLFAYSVLNFESEYDAKKTFKTFKVCDLDVNEPINATPIDPPTMSITITVNSSPLAGTEGKKLTSTQIRNRLILEAENNVGIDEIVQQIESFKSYEEQNKLLEAKRNKRKITEIESLLLQKVKLEVEELKKREEIINIISDASSGKIKTEEAVNLIFKFFKNDWVPNLESFS